MEMRSYVILLLQIIYLTLPVAVILFWNKKRRGWILTAFILSYMIADAFTHIWIFMFAEIIVFGVALWLICKGEMRDIFRINKESMYWIVFGGAFVKGAILLIGI
jgi:ABC-type sugar transport system permease subunit